MKLFLGNITIVTILGCLALPIKAASAQNLWNGFSVGDEETRIFEKFPDAKKERICAKGKEECFNILSVSNFGNPECGFDVKFTLDINKKIQSIVSVSNSQFVKLSDLGVKSCLSQITNDLISKYGKPLQFGYLKDGKFAESVWSINDNVYVSFKASNYFFSIIYSTSKPNLEEISPLRDLKSSL